MMTRARARARWRWQAALYWRQFEGDYRDDISCTVAYLPQLTAQLLDGAAAAESPA